MLFYVSLCTLSCVSLLMFFYASWGLQNIFRIAFWSIDSVFGMYLCISLLAVNIDIRVYWYYVLPVKYIKHSPLYIPLPAPTYNNIFSNISITCTGNYIKQCYKFSSKVECNLEKSREKSVCIQSFTLL